MVVLCVTLCMVNTRAAQKQDSRESMASFRMHKGRTYRMVDRSAYLVLDTASFYIYKYNKLVQGQKIARPTDVYYFSLGPNSPMQELTRVNLEKAFAGNRAFLYRLSADFSSDKDLVTYIPSLKTYKIKYAYGQSIQ